MATGYPGSVDSYTRPATSDPLDSGATKGTTVADNMYDAIEAIETELGTDPSGTFTTVKDRLDALFAQMMARTLGC